MATKSKAILLGDAHFGAPTHQYDDNERRKEFVEFLEQFAELTETLVITGDLFDFWFEYPNVVPVHYLDILDALESATRKTRVVYLPGNHDLWVGTTIRNLGQGIDVRESILLKLNDKKVMVTHGHQLSRHISTRILNSILSNPVAIFMFRLIHPTVGYSIGRVVSRLSRLRNSELGKLPADLEEFTLSIEQDVLIVGHFHRPKILKKGKKAIIVAGDWLLYRNYTVITDKGVEIYDYKTNQVVESLSFDDLGRK